MHYTQTIVHECDTNTQIKVIIKEKVGSLTYTGQACLVGLPWPELILEIYHMTLVSVFCIHLKYNQHYNLC